MRCRTLSLLPMVAAAHFRFNGGAQEDAVRSEKDSTIGTVVSESRPTVDTAFTDLFPVFQRLAVGIFQFLKADGVAGALMGIEAFHCPYRLFLPLYQWPE